MHFTLHLSNQCNMRCSYCYVEKGSTIMSIDVLKKAISLAAKQTAGQTVGIAFLGGEPLLHKELITEAVNYCHQVVKQEGVRFSMKLTTNGLSLDDAFLDYADQEGIFIALSIDGITEAHNYYRQDAFGHATHAAVFTAAQRLLARQRCSPAITGVPTGASLAGKGYQSHPVVFSSPVCSLLATTNTRLGMWIPASMRKAGRGYLNRTARASLNACAVLIKTAALTLVVV